MGHILGFMVDLFEYYYNFDTGTIYGTLTKNVTCVDGTSQTLEVPRNLREIQVKGASFFELISHTVVNIAKNQFRCEKNTVGVRLASDYESCFGSSHWSEVSPCSKNYAKLQQHLVNLSYLYFLIQSAYNR